SLTAECRGVTGAGLVHLKGHPNLRTIKLGSSEVKDAGFGGLRDIPKLEEVDLKKANIRAEGYKFLSDIKTLKRIRAPQTATDDACLAAIAGMKQLELLDLQDCNLVSEKGLVVLKGFPKLRFLRLYGPTITDKV